MGAPHRPGHRSRRQVRRRRPRQPRQRHRRRALGKCLDVAGPSTANGTQTHLWDCHGSASQQWTATAAGDLTSVYANKYLSAGRSPPVPSAGRRRRRAARPHRVPPVRR
ncbi:RICIN domain-containing protein [Virgisporangium ochraceum]|uniref:RICIN domain-containing protein n=1 Tax=Virgisporangium ochraceum TaxID=65505 RepID=UPI00194560AF|nr:RICIN domain-containing protein [Virgisporangium ochraceum]